MGRTLGLDLGPNSIGWALIDEDEQSIVATGVRVFPEGVDNFDTGKEESRNVQRRTARGMRRQTQRRSRRRQALRQALTQAGLLPADPEQLEELFRQDPYKLRAGALDEPLHPHEIGRAFLHIAQRRGFQSNRKKDAGDKEVEGMKAEISQLASDIDASGSRTLGEYLYRKVQTFDHINRVEDDHIRNRHTRRDMLEREFNLIWDAQAAHHPSLLTDELRHGRLGAQKYPRRPIARHNPQRHSMSDLEAFGLHGMIFFQRPMYWPRSVVGLCELEPKEKRCPRAHRDAQRARVLQEVNNLRFIDPDKKKECALDEGQRQMIVEHLATRQKATFDEIRKKLGFDETVKFSLERGKRPSIKGMTSDWMAAKAIGKEWHKRSEADKSAIFDLLLDDRKTEDEILHGLVNNHGLTSEQAETLLGLNLPEGYGSLSLKAIRKLLPHLEQGMRYMADDDSDSALKAAGYLRPDQLQRRIFDKLPLLHRAKDTPLGDIPNPVVKRTLVELRKVVNAILREHGKPDAVHVEMARSVQMGPKRRSEYNSRLRQREADRADAAETIRKHGVAVSRDAITRYLLWQEQAHECIYCGSAISVHQLFGGEIDVDHILPYSRSLDNAQSNKVVCHRHCNAQKSNRTPYEWLAETRPNDYERVCQHANSLMRKGLFPYAKYRRFLQKNVDTESFIQRQLVDTGYIARATVEYLHCLFDDKHTVLGLKGQYTATLRHQWGLETILSDLPDSPAWAEKNSLRPGEKNRADHRHHAIDAIVLALTNRSRLQQLTRYGAAGKLDRTTGELHEETEPWPDLRNHIRDKIAAINVSHRVRRKVAGGLHEDTIYGPVRDKAGNVVPGEFVVRKPLANLTANEIPSIRDNAILRLVQRKLAEHGLETGRKKKPDPKKLAEVLSDIRMPSGVPVKKVRIKKKEKTIQPIRVGKSGEAWVKPGNTHHLCIFEWDHKGKTKRDAAFVTMLEAARRARNGTPIIRRSPPAGHDTIPPHAKFIMSLSAGEMVLADWKGQQKLLTYRTAASTTGQMIFIEHTDARRSSGTSPATKFTAYANSLQARKVTIDPLGRVRWAND